MSIVGTLNMVAPWNIYTGDTIDKKLPAILAGGVTLYLGYSRGGLMWAPFALWIGSPLFIGLFFGLIMGMAG